MRGDPTRIDLVNIDTTSSDPLERWMEGVARHGYTPFAFPYISEIADNLWMGGCEQDLVLPSFFRHLVSLYPWESYQAETLDTMLSVTAYDGDEVDDTLILELAQWVNARRHSGAVLVHCQAGLNRSGLVTALALMLHEGLTAAEAIALLREKRSPAVLCNKTFPNWLEGR